MSATPIVPTQEAKDRLRNLLGTKRPVPAYNQALHEKAVSELQGPSDDKGRKAQVDTVKQIFAEYVSGQGKNATFPDQAPVPSRIRQQVINRIHSRVMADNWAMSFGDAQEVGFGEQLVYRVSGVKLPSVYKMAEPGGNWTEIHKNRDGYFTLDEPAIYTTPEIWIPRFNPRYPDRYLDDLAFVADMAAIAMNDALEADALTALQAQFVASGMRAGAHDWIASGVISGNVPDTNILSETTAGKVNVAVYKTMAEYVMKTGRRMTNLYMAPDTILGMFDEYNAAASSTYFANFPEVQRQRFFEQGGGAYNHMFGVDFPVPTPINSIDVSSSDKYFYGLLEPTDPMLPRGAFWFYTWPAPNDYGEYGSAYVVDNLEWITTARRAGQVYDVFVLQKNALFASVSYQQPNAIKVMYAT